MSTARTQGDIQNESDPVPQFIETVRALLESKAGHLIAPDERQPEDCLAWGWKSGSNEPFPGGTQLGVIKGEDVYLYAGVIFGEVQSFLRKSNAPIPISFKTLGKRLAEAGLLLSRDREDRHTSRMSVGRRRHSVYHFHKSTFYSGESDRPDQSARVLRFPQTA